MSLLITTQSYSRGVPTCYGYLLEMDDRNGNIIRKLKIDTPITSNVEGERLKPGLRGLFFYKKKIFTASWNKLYVVNPDSFKVENEISHKWMSDVHGIYVDENGIWVTSCLPDAVILYDFDGNPKNVFWAPETKLYPESTKVEKDIDWRHRGKDFKGSKRFHANHVSVYDGKVFITGRGRKNNSGRVITFDLNLFLSRQENLDGYTLFMEGLYGPHDGLWDNDRFWLTETRSSTLTSCDRSGSIRYRRAVKESENEKINNGNLIKKTINFYKKLRGKQDFKLSHWTRGLTASEDRFFVGQSTWAGDDVARARVVTVDKKSGLISNCFYLNIPDYPETRIFQLLHFE